MPAQLLRLHVRSTAESLRIGAAESARSRRTDNAAYRNKLEGVLTVVPKGRGGEYEPERAEHSPSLLATRFSETLRLIGRTDRNAAADGVQSS